MLQLSGFRPHLGRLQAASPLPVVCGWTSPSRGPRETELREYSNILQLRPAKWGIAAPSNLQGLQSCKQELQKEPAGDNTRVSREDVLREIHNTLSITRRCFRSCDQEHRQQPSQGKSNSLQEIIPTRKSIKTVSQCALKILRIK
jgi:hypothetical protein